VLRIFGLKRDEMIGGWRKLSNEEVRNLYPSPNIIRMIKPWMTRWAGHVACMAQKGNAHRILVGEPERKETTRKT
jgi:hypothetical protein